MISVIEMFSGIGCQRQALKNIGLEHEVIGISEIDKYAISSYNQIHGDTFNFGDIRDIDHIPKVTLLTYSFPCQDLSRAGTEMGIKKGTRSGLLLELEEILDVSEKPDFLLMENVKGLIGKKFRKEFDRWCSKLEEMGYTNYYAVLDARDFDIPQSRERVFMVSVKDNIKQFSFPEGLPQTRTLRDFLEDDSTVDERRFIDREYTLTGKKTGIVAMKNLGNFEQGKRIYGIDGYINTIPARDRGVNNILLDDGRIRKITTKEAWRLMGWEDEALDKIQGVPNTQLYKQAGNGIVIPILEEIFKKIFY